MAGGSNEVQHGAEPVPADLLPLRFASRRDEAGAVCGARRANRRREEDRPDALPHGQALWTSSCKYSPRLQLPSGLGEVLLELEIILFLLRGCWGINTEDESRPW